jgi:hypothetical protein
MWHQDLLHAHYAGIDTQRLSVTYRSDYHHFMDNWNKVLRFNVKMAPPYVGPFDAERR